MILIFDWIYIQYLHLSMSEKKTSQKCLSVSQKVALIHAHEKNQSQAQLAKECDLSKPAVKYIIDNKDKFKDAADNGSTSMPQKII